MAHHEGPTFLILGAQRSGTTWFASMLTRQPNVFLPACKELHFFTRYYGNGREWYDAQFAAASASGFSVRGEATPNYLAVTHPEYAQVADRIAGYRRDLRFVVLLRNPIDRALSAFLHHAVRGRFSPLRGIETHLSDLLQGRDRFGVLEFGRYGAHLAHYLRLFDRSQFHVLLYEELAAGNAQSMLSETLEFLGAQRTDVRGPFDKRVNVAPRSLHAARLGCLLSFWMRNDPIRVRFGGMTARLARAGDIIDRPVSLDVEIRRQLADYYYEDVCRLRGLLGRHLDAWSDFYSDPFGSGKETPRGTQHLMR